MSVLKKCLVLTPLLLGAGAASHAGSSQQSWLSDSAGSSIGGSSDSFNSSSQNSSDSLPRRGPVAQGDYRIIEMTAVPERAGIVRMTLQALEGQGGADPVFFLYLPRQAVEQGRLAQGDTVTARPRPYGVEFLTAGERREAFFLVLQDEWLKELKPNPVL